MPAKKMPFVGIGMSTQNILSEKVGLSSVKKGDRYK